MIAVKGSTTVPKLGLLTVPLHFKECKPRLTGIQDAARFAKSAGYDTLQVAMFPTVSKDGTIRDFSAMTADPKFLLDKANAAEITEGLAAIKAETGVGIDSVCFCANPLGNLEDREHLKAVIDAGAVLGARSVVTFIGNPFPLAGKPLSGADLRKFFVDKLATDYAPLVNQTTQLGLEFDVEDCPMYFTMSPNGSTPITNMFFTPALKRLVLSVLPDIKIHFDGSHTRNYRGAREENPAASRTIAEIIAEFGDAFGQSIHLKDGVDDPKGMADHLGAGDMFEPNTHTQGLWIARAPGRGAIDWLHFEMAMKAFAPRSTARIVELEDTSASSRADNEQLFIGVAQFYRNIFEQVYGSKG
ncbi:MAG: TIM barrel protein [Candidatus Saganbacteria bacterium]|nr:TIM barrel protein [Candidatus Saganbacteria bacterium]